MAATLTGVVDWGLTRSDEGHRDYTVSFDYITDDPNDGPKSVMDCVDNPQIGDIWSLSTETDEWAVCTPYIKVTPRIREEKGIWWRADFKFSTRNQVQRCQDTPVEDPLLEPPQVSGSFIKYNRERFSDRHGNILQNTAFELFRGPQAEFDANRPTVTIAMNSPTLDLDDLCEMVDTVNDGPMWGLAERTVKLSNVSWTRYILGTCDYFYQRVFDFDIDFNTWDRYILNEGTKVLFGQHNPISKNWELVNIGGNPPDPTDPDHYIRYKDPNDENARVILDKTTGRPITKTQIQDVLNGAITADPSVWYHQFEVYNESDFFLLGIPTEF